MKKLYAYETSAGTFYIAEKNGRYHVLFNDASLGSYDKPETAAGELAGGHTFSAGIDMSMVKVSDDLSDWERLF